MIAEEQTLRRISKELHEGRNERLAIFRTQSDTLHSTEGEKIHSAAMLAGWDAAISVVNAILKEHEGRK
jgi:hypothetical protein